MMYKGILASLARGIGLNVFGGCTVAIIGAVGVSLPAAADDYATDDPSKPKIEAGVGIGAQYIRDYRGSKESQLQMIPVPFAIYRGKFIKVDREGLRGEIVKTRRFEINLSADVALNGDSHDNELRRGMPELDSAFEFGPSFNINLTGQDFEHGWAIRFPLRSVVTVSTDGFEPIGYTSDPKLTFRKQNVFGEWRLSANFAALFASDKYHSYYYDVAPEFVTESRGEYDAQAGFSGFYTKASLSQRRGNLFYGISVRYDNISDAVFSDSPLVETDHFVSVSAGFAWIFWQSKK